MAVDEHSGVYVTLVRAQNLAAKDLNGLSDPYVKVRLFNGLILKNSVRTKTVWKSLDPEWNETLYVGKLHDKSKAHLGVKRESCYIRFRVWDEDRVTPDDFIGEAILTFDKIPEEGGNYTLGLVDKRGRLQTDSRLIVSVSFGPEKLSKGYTVPSPVHHHGCHAR